MATYELDGDKILSLAAGRRLHSQAAIAAAAQISPRAVWKAIHGKRVNGSTTEGIARALGLERDFQVLLVKVGRNEAPRVSDRHMDGEDGESTMLTKRILKGPDRQDMKLVLASQALSAGLVSGRKIPAFAECLKETRVFTPVDDEHKDHPCLPAIGFNHFIQPSVLVTLQLERGPRVIGYYRTKKPSHPGHVHTVGPSILFACSPRWNVVRHRRTPLDGWLDDTADPARAAHDLVAGEFPVILQLVRYKIDLIGYRCRITPFGIITRDERRESFRRVYTQYVFHVELAVKAKDVDQFVKCIRADGAVLNRLDDDLDPEELFVGKSGRINAMDVAAWFALHKGVEKCRFGESTFRRGFDAV